MGRSLEGGERVEKGIVLIAQGCSSTAFLSLIAVSFLCIHSPESVNFIYFGKEADN